MDIVLPLILLLVGLGVGGALGGWRARAAAAEQQTRLDGELAATRATLESERAARAEAMAQQAAVLREQAAAERARLEADARTQVTTARAVLETERRALNEKLAMVEQTRAAMSAQFREVAGEVLAQRAEALQAQNAATLQQALDPVRTRLGEFQTKVEELYVNEGRARAELRGEIGQLMALNQQLSSNADRLATALRGEKKTQGNWGEWILERTLESCGLVRGQHYETQVAHTAHDGTRQLPDVVLHLPGDRDLVIDSKVSLVHFEAASAATTEPDRSAAALQHAASMRRHADDLHKRDYRSLPGVRTLDFVVMFVPIEPAWLLGLQTDPELWRYCWDRNVLLVSPTTLLFVVRTVATLWTQESQRTNALEIAERGGRLYDKLADALTELEKVGSAIDSTRKAYDTAMSRLGTGNGNVLRQAEKLRELGVKSSKKLPARLAAGVVGDEE